MRKFNYITYISPEEAEKYISQDDDIFDSDIKYFTCIPCSNPLYPSSEGWEDVIYYTGRRKVHYIETDVDYQYVYILSNKSMPGLIKIGFTDKTPQKRVEGLNKSTGVPMDFDIEWAFPCFNAIRLEKEIHDYFDGYRLRKNREFFRIDIETAKENIRKIGEKYQFKEE